MAEAQRILGTESLRQSYPKLNAAIDNSNEALTKATTAESNSATAVNTANTAETKADSTQAQLDTIIIESGTSDAETLQARTNADALTFTTLQERLNNSDSQVAQTKKQISGIINVKEYGAVGDGVADDTQAIIAAEQEAFSRGSDTRLKIPRGNYKTTGKIMIRCSLDADEATIQYYGTGTALVIGNDTGSNIVTARKRFWLPRVICMNRGTTGWDGTSVGVLTVNLNTCEVYVPFIQDFEKGLVAYGLDGGHAHTTFHLGALWENHKNLVLDCTSTGYVNQNLFLNGRLQHSTTKGAVLDDINANQVLMVGINPEGGPNNNTFINTSFEGQTVSYYRVDIAGSYNQFINCRWETPDNVPLRVRYRSTAINNRIEGGYGAVNIDEVFEGTLGGGVIFDHWGGYTSAGCTTGQLIPNALNTNILWNSGHVSRKIAYNAETGEFTPRPGRWRIMASIAFSPNNLGRRKVNLRAGGVLLDMTEVPPSSERHTMKLEGVYKFDGVKTFQIEAWQNSGSLLSLEPTSGYVTMQAEYLGI
jgi:hypothetical protein